MKELTLRIIPDFPMIKEGDNLGIIILDAVRNFGYNLKDGDIFVLAQKIVSKAEGRLVPLESVIPTDEAVALASETEKDPRLVQLILNESIEIMRSKPGVIIVRNKLGHVGAKLGQVSPLLGQVGQQQGTWSQSGAKVCQKSPNRSQVTP